MIGTHAGSGPSSDQRFGGFVMTAKRRSSVLQSATAGCPRRSVVMRARPSLAILSARTRNCGEQIENLASVRPSANCMMVWINSTGNGAAT